jgi:predicted dehydrogenase
MAERTLALLGAAHVHLPDHLRVARDEGWGIVAVHDRDPARRTAWCERLGAAPLDRADDVARAGASAVLVCSETVHHEADIGAALECGLPVFAEKPLGADAATAARLAAAADRSGVLLDTAYFMRTNPALAEVRDRVRDGAIGAVVEARMRFSHDGAYADWLDLDGWMTRPELASYGGFADEAVHCVDWLLWTLGPVLEGYGVRGHALGYPVDDHGAGVLRFESGATATVEAGWTDTRMRLELDLVGSEGGARLHEGQVDLRRRDGAAPIWSAEIGPLDAGEGIRPFLAAVAEGRRTGLVAPGEAAAVNAAIDRLYGRTGASGPGA